MATRVNEGTWTQYIQKEGVKENTWTYEKEVRGELRKLIVKEHRN